MVALATGPSYIRLLHQQPATGPFLANQQATNRSFVPTLNADLSCSPATVDSRNFGIQQERPVVTLLTSLSHARARVLATISCLSAANY